MNIVKNIKNDMDKVLKKYNDVLSIQIYLKYKNGLLSQERAGDVLVDSGMPTKDLFELKTLLDTMFDVDSMNIYYEEDVFYGDYQDSHEFFIHYYYDFESKEFLEVLNADNVEPFSFLVKSSRAPEYQNSEITSFPDNAWKHPALEELLISADYIKPDYITNDDLSQSDTKEYLEDILKTVSNCNFESYVEDYPVYLHVERDFAPRVNFIEILIELKDKYNMKWNGEKTPESLHFPLTALIERKEDFHRRKLDISYRVYSTTGVPKLSALIYDNFIKPLNIYNREEEFTKSSEINLKVLINKKVNIDNLSILSDYSYFRAFDGDTLVASITNLEQKYHGKFLNLLKEFFKKYLLED